MVFFMDPGQEKSWPLHFFHANLNDFLLETRTMMIDWFWLIMMDEESMKRGKNSTVENIIFVFSDL